MTEKAPQRTTFNNSQSTTKMLPNPKTLELSTVDCRLSTLPSFRPRTPDPVNPSLAQVLSQTLRPFAHLLARGPITLLNFAQLLHLLARGEHVKRPNHQRHRQRHRQCSTNNALLPNPLHPTDDV